MVQRLTNCKFRGYKVVVKFFPNEAANLEPVVDLLMKIQAQVKTAVLALPLLSCKTA